MTRHGLALLFMLFCIPLFYYAQSCTLFIEGVVIDEHDQSNLAFSTVYIPALNRGMATDEEGKFRLDKLCAGEYELVISHIGCETDTVSLVLKESITKTFYLEHHLEELREIEVLGNKLNRSGSKSELSKEDFDEKSGQALGEILKSINGVNTLKTGSNISKPIIGGFTSNRIQIMNQGVQLQSQQWGDEHAPEIDPFAAANYAVIRGAGAVKYTGGAIGGLVLVEPKVLPGNAGWSAELNSLYATNNRMGNTSLMLEGRTKLLPRFAWRVQGSWKRSGNVRTPNYYQKNTGVKELNGTVDLGYFGEQWNLRVFYSQFNSEIGIFSGAHIGNLTDLKNAIERQEPRVEDQEGFSYEIRRPYQLIEHELAKAELNWYPTSWGKVNLKISRQFNIREEFDKDRRRGATAAEDEIPEFSLGLESYTGSVNWELPGKKGWKTQLGANWVELENSVNSFTDFIPDYTSSIYSLYGIEKWSEGKLNAEFGFRVDKSLMTVSKLIDRVFNTFEYDFTALTLNAGASYFFDKNNVLGASVTMAERPPAINELHSEGLHHGTASLEFGSIDLSKEKSLAFSLNYQLTREKLKYTIYSYYQQISDFIYLRPNGLDLTVRGAFPTFSWENTDAVIRGFDQTVEVKVVENVWFKNALSFVWGNDKDRDRFLINMPANRIENTLRYSYFFSDNKEPLQIKIGNELVLKQRRFNKDEEIADPPEGFHLINMALSYQLNLKNKQQLTFGIRADNMLNERYRSYLNRFRFFSDEQGRNITFRIKYKI